MTTRTTKPRRASRPAAERPAAWASACACNSPKTPPGRRCWSRSLACSAAEALNGACLNESAAERLTGETLFIYDSNAGYTAAPTQGKLAKQRTLLRFAGPGKTDPRYHDEAYEYDAWGNRTLATAYSAEGGTSFGLGETRTITTTYDTLYHSYALTVTNALTQTTGYTYNYDLGLPISITGPNGADTTVSAEYDGFGRLVKIIRPGDSASQPTLMAIYHDPATAGDRMWVDLRQRITGGNYAVWRKVYDGLGRLFQAQTANANLNGQTKDVRVDYSYDAAGRLAVQSMPYEVAPWDGQSAFEHGEGDDIFETVTAYDAFGRTSLITAPDATATTYGYDDLTVTVTDTLGNTTTTISDIWGRTAEIDPADGPGLSYTYDTQDRLVSALRGAATVSLAYDQGGHKITMSDPDMGLWEYSYDASGNLVRQKDARGQYICLYYDAIHRPTGKDYRTNDDCPATRPDDADVRFAYDGYNPAIGHFGRGQRTAMADASGTTLWRYDTRGRVILDTRMVTGQGTFVTAWDYNAADLPVTMQYPADNLGGLGETVTTTYHNQLTLNSVFNNINSEVYVTGTYYDPAGRVIERRMGDQGYLRTGYLYHPWTSQGGRLQKTIGGMSTGQLDSLMDLRYTYDGVGNVLIIQDYKMGGPQTQTFTYDDLYRLQTASAAGGYNQQGNYAQETYNYDAATGNLASKAGVSYTYGDGNHDHAVTALSNGSLFIYDANGNMTTRQIGGQTYNLTYNPENHMTQVSGAATATFAYNGDGQRVLSIENGVTTVFIGNYYEWRGATATAVKYYYAGSQRVAMRTGGNEPLFLLGDHLGSTSKIVHENGTLLTPGGLRLYKVWGETRYEPDGELAANHRYTGQYEEPSIGLYDYGARWYDPALGRFAQPDSIIPLATQGTQAWDRYAGMNNNPVRYSDPTGHMVDDGCRDGCTARKGAEYRDYVYNDVYGDVDKRANSEKVETVMVGGAEFIISILWEPADWALTARDCLDGNCSPLTLLGLLPLIPGSVIDDVTSSAVGGVYKLVNPAG